jgi:two-component system sensor histidine kinase/response regulator
MASSTNASPAIALSRRPPEACKILIVDDEPKVIEVIAYHLEREGYEVLSAPDGKEALECVVADAPDLIITDVMMPNVDGIELCRRVKGNIETHFIPVIVVTARGSKQVKLDSLDAGADDFVDKPVDALELSTRVRALLYTKQLHDELGAYRRDLEKRVEERTSELKAAYERLKELDKLKTNFIGNVSHELRTPLHQIRTAISLLGEKELSSDEQATVFGAAEETLESLSQLVEDILVLNTYNEPQIEMASVAEIIDASIKRMQSLPKRHAAEIEANVPPGLPLVWVDRDGLARVLHHLIDNAIKFSDGKPVLVSAEAIEGGVRVSIKDKGIGISRDQQRRLSELLYQAETGITRRHSGLGIGLTLSRLVLGAHGIEIDIESQKGTGTTVSFDLPIAKVAKSV